MLSVKLRDWKFKINPKQYLFLLENLCKLVFFNGCYLLFINDNFILGSGSPPASRRRASRVEAGRSLPCECGAGMTVELRIENCILWPYSSFINP